MTTTGPPIDATAGRRVGFLAGLMLVAGAAGWVLGFPLPMDFSGWVPVLLVAVVGIAIWAYVLPRFVPSFGVRLALLAVVGLVASWFLVAPMFVNNTVDEALPGAAPAGGDAEPAPADGEAPPAEAGDTAATKRAEGAFEGIGHSAQGMVGLYEVADGSAVVRLEDVEIQNGPDLFVYLVPEPGQIDDTGGVNLGRLKGNIGSSNYPVPAEVNVEDFSTVLIWCRAFSTPFANATFADV